MTGATTIVVADDHAVVRKGLEALLHTEPGLDVIATARDGVEAVHLVERLKPHVLIVDVMMPTMNGLEVARQLRERAPGTRVILLTMHASEAYLQEALRAGALGYVLKDASDAELVDAVRTVARGRRYLSPALVERAVHAYAEQASAVPPAEHEQLSAREREVLHLAAEGRSASEIGARLHLSPRTVETHRGNLMRKLGLRSQTDLIRYALRHGIIPLE